MDPEIRYATTTDGVNIAYWTMGRGPALILGAPLGTFSHIALELRYPPALAAYERLAAKRTLIRYDQPNYGLSDRGVQHLSIEDWSQDAIAVADKLALESFDMINFGVLPGVAALQPARVRRLCLMGLNSPKMARSLDESQFNAVLSLAEKDWRIYTQTQARFFMNWRDEGQGLFAQFIRTSVAQQDMVRMLAAWRTWDFTSHLRRVSCPTLVVTAARRSGSAVADGAREYVAGIEHARLVCRRRA